MLPQEILRCHLLISDGTLYFSLAAEQKTMHALKWSQNVVLFFEFISNKKSEIKSSNSFTQRLSYNYLFNYQILYQHFLIIQYFCLGAFSSERVNSGVCWRFIFVVIVAV